MSAAPSAGPMNHQLISSEGNGGNYNPPEESWRLHRSLSVLLSFDLDIIDRHLALDRRQYNASHSPDCKEDATIICI